MGDLQSTVKSVKSIGALGRDVLKDIILGLENSTNLRPVAGKVTIEINLRVEDEHFFKDDIIRDSKLVLEVTLAKDDSILIL